MDKTTFQLGATIVIETVIQVLKPSLLETALKTSCRKIRYGSEFCMYAIPSLGELKEAYAATEDAGKEFVYVTPRVSDAPMERIKEQLRFLDERGENVVVINDLGSLNSMKEFEHIKPHLGRQLIYTPSRCPWKEITENPVSIFTKRKVEKIFYQTALNYEPTIDFYKSYNVVGADIDWIPQIFPGVQKIIKKGINVSAHLYKIPVAITRKCHMARFLGEENLDTCSRPCYREAYYMSNETLGNEFYLHGNTVYRKLEPNRSTLSRLGKSGVGEVILTLNPLNKAGSSEEIEKEIKTIQNM